MYKFKINYAKSFVCFCLLIALGCKVPEVMQRAENKSVPENYQFKSDSTNIGNLNWRRFFKDPYLQNLIDSAIHHNQDLMMSFQEMEIARNDIRLKKGAIAPNVQLGMHAGITKVGRYTADGAGNATTDIIPGTQVPFWLPDQNLAVSATWEIDIWKKLHNAKQAAVNRYLATVEGKNFVLTNLIADVANSYYQLLSLDQQLVIVKENIALQSNALEIVKVQKEAARATELGVKKFEAEVLNTKNLEFDILQNITETENRINFLLGRYPQAILRDTSNFVNIIPETVQSGIPTQLLANRPDIKQAEQALLAAKLDVKVARADFFPTLDISAAVGLDAFKPNLLLKLPSALLANLAGDLAGPLINKSAIKAQYFSANAKQLEAVYFYEKTVLNAYIEVYNQLSNIDNLHKSYQLKDQQVTALNQSVSIANDLFKSARADYFEVLMTQRDALSTKLELIDTKKEQLNAVVNIYKSLGGGWK